MFHPKDKKVYDAIYSHLSAEFYSCGGAFSWTNFVERLKELNPSYSIGRKKGFISFSRKTKNKDGKFVEKRYRLTTARFLTRQLNLSKLFNTHITSSEIKKISDRIDRDLFKAPSFNIINGSEISCMYEDAFGNESCMTNHHYEYTLLYEMNPDKVEMICAENGTNQARCILWTLDCGHKYADRIYDNASSINRDLRDFIEKKGFYSFNKRNSLDRMFVSNLTFEQGCVPYMDTFIYGKVDIKKNLLNLSSDCISGYDITLDRTNGVIDIPDYEQCNYCGEIYDTRYLRHIDGRFYCDRCTSELFTACDYCGNWVKKDDAVEVYVVERLHHPITGVKTIVGTMKVCNTCVDRYCKKCSICGKLGLFQGRRKFIVVSYNDDDKPTKCHECVQKEEEEKKEKEKIKEESTDEKEKSENYQVKSTRFVARDCEPTEVEFQNIILNNYIGLDNNE